MEIALLIILTIAIFGIYVYRETLKANDAALVEELEMLISDPEFLATVKNAGFEIIELTFSDDPEYRFGIKRIDRPYGYVPSISRLMPRLKGQKYSDFVMLYRLIQISTMPNSAEEFRVIS